MPQTFSVTVPDSAVTDLVAAASAREGITPPTTLAGKLALGNTVCKEFLHEMVNDWRSQQAGINARTTSQAEPWP